MPDQRILPPEPSRKARAHGERRRSLRPEAAVRDQIRQGGRLDQHVPDKVEAAVDGGTQLRSGGCAPKLAAVREPFGGDVCAIEQAVVGAAVLEVVEDLVRRAEGVGGTDASAVLAVQG